MKLIGIDITPEALEADGWDKTSNAHGAPDAHTHFKELTLDGPYLGVSFRYGTVSMVSGYAWGHKKHIDGDCKDTPLPNIKTMQQLRDYLRTEGVKLKGANMLQETKTAGKWHLPNEQPPLSLTSRWVICIVDERKEVMTGLQFRNSVTEDIPEAQKGKWGTIREGYNPRAWFPYDPSRVGLEPELPLFLEGK